MGIRSWFNRGKTIPDMYGSVTRHEKDLAGNDWFTIDPSCNTLLKDRMADSQIDMTTDSGKMLALQVCTPFSTVIDKTGSLFANGEVYIVDKDNNDIENEFSEELKSLLDQPNPFQSRSLFLKQVEMISRTFGRCPIFTFRATRNSLPYSLWIIPPPMFKMIYSGKHFNQKDKKKIVKEVFIDLGNNEQITLNEEDYFLINNADIVFPDKEDEEIGFSYVTDSLSAPVSNWVSQMVASHTLIANGGPKGILHNDDNSEIGNAVLTPKEKEELHRKFHSYGLVNKLFSVLITTAKVGWIPLNYNSSQLKLHEEGVRSRNDISNAIGINPNIFVSDSTYANQESAKRAAYEDLIIPDSLIVSQALTSHLCQDKAIIKIDYTHISCLQEDRKDSAQTLNNLSSALKGLMSSGILTRIEARKELSKYIDINPNEPEGELIINNDGREE